MNIIKFASPIALVVLSNIFYHICAKSLPDSVNPFASLVITYLVGAVVSAILYFSLSKGGNIVKEIGKMNFSPYILGIVIVGLETGFIYAYKVGWMVSTASIVQSAFQSIALIIVGYLLYNEMITWNKLVGIGICLVGLFFINMR